MLNVKATIVSKMTSHCAGTVQMREEYNVAYKQKELLNTGSNKYHIAWSCASS